MKESTGVHRRFDPLSGRWILVSPHRTQRPWSGLQEASPASNLQRHDSSCYLCPRMTRVSGAKNPDYHTTFVFENDVPALLPDSESRVQNSELFRTEPAMGTSRVICFSPRHDLTLTEFNHSQFLEVINTWIEQAEELGQTYKWVQIFENKGSAMGASSPHPHGQIWASKHLPTEAQREDDNQRVYYERNGSPLLTDYASEESKLEERVVLENGDWLVVVPYWATWPFETLLLPRHQIRSLVELDESLRRSLIAIMTSLLKGYDNLFQTSFPYSMGWHMAPFLTSETSHWILHAHFYPPLLRSASIRKFMVGYEMLGESQRDLTPESAASRLKEVCL